MEDSSQSSSHFNDVVLECDEADTDCLYRIGRFSEHDYHVVYVTINNIDLIIPERMDRVFPSAIFRELRKHSQWAEHSWRTMELSLKDDRIIVELDREPPHSMTEHEDLLDLPRYNLFWFDKTVRLNCNTTSRVHLGDRSFIAKIAPFRYLLPFISNEVAIYHAFIERQSALLPRLFGYVYEEHPDRVVGFLCEAIEGKHPGPTQRSKCREALQQLHEQGLYHGDINNYNMIVTAAGEIVFIDFETSVLVTSEEQMTAMAAKMQEEMEILERCPLAEIDKLEAPYTIRVSTL